MNDNALELLKNALLSPDNEDLLSQVRESAAKIRESLEEGELNWSDADTERLEEKNEWVARVYRAFAESEAVTEEEEREDELTRVIDQMHADKDLESATAFATALETLPEEFHQWDLWFSDVPEAPKDYQRYICEQTVVTKGGEHAAGMIPYGLTPGTFAEAAHGFELLVNRLVRTAGRVSEQRSEVAAPLVLLLLELEFLTAWVSITPNGGGFHVETT